MKRIAIFASGNGTNLEAILKQVKSGELPVEVPFCFSDNRRAKALERAENLDFQTVSFTPRMFSSREEYEAQIAVKLRGEDIDYVVLAGYMLLLGERFVEQFRNKIINIHPALLPSFKGVQAIKDAWEYGVKYTGITVHFVNEEMDGGPVIEQVLIPIEPGETLESLEERVHKEEYKFYSTIIKKVVTQNYKIKGRNVIFDS